MAPFVAPLALTLSLALAVNACDDGYAKPEAGGTYCDQLASFLDGQNCWGSCVTGCPSIKCPSAPPGSTCYMETRPVSDQGSCVWPANTKLCCAHIGSVDGVPLKAVNASLVEAFNTERKAEEAAEVADEE